jgi:3-oxoadipate enol-lactonase
MPTLTIDGAELYYEVHGEGPLLVFAHGAGGNHLSWWQQVPAFRDRYTCVTFDHRGWGATRDARPPGEWPSFDSDLGALIDHLGAGEVRLVAQSMGGWTCLAYATRNPGRVRGLVMADTVGGLLGPRMPDPLRRAARPPGEPLANAALGVTFQRTNAVMTFLYGQIATLNPPRDLSQTGVVLRRHPVTEEEVQALACPVLFIHGDEDVLIPLESARAASTILPNARLEVVAGAGHSVYFEQPEAFNALVAGLLAEVDGAG